MSKLNIIDSPRVSSLKKLGVYSLTVANGDEAGYTFRDALDYEVKGQ